jgi:hypothetical protein
VVDVILSSDWCFVAGAVGEGTPPVAVDPVAARAVVVCAAFVACVVPIDPVGSGEPVVLVGSADSACVVAFFVAEPLADSDGEGVSAAGVELAMTLIGRVVVVDVDVVVAAADAVVTDSDACSTTDLTPS